MRFFLFKLRGLSAELKANSSFLQFEAKRSSLYNELFKPPITPYEAVVTM